MERNARDDFDRSLGTAADASVAAPPTDTASSTAPTTEGTSTTGGSVKNTFGTIRERATHLQATLADRLDAGAERIRQRAHPAPSTGTGQLAAASDAGTVDVGTSTEVNRSARVADSVASGMHNTADWLRNGDLRADVERQVRDHPGRSLLIALGLGLLIGKSLRSK